MSTPPRRVQEGTDRSPDALQSQSFELVTVQSFARPGGSVLSIFRLPCETAALPVFATWYLATPLSPGFNPEVVPLPLKESSGPPPLGATTRREELIAGLVCFPLLAEILIGALGPSAAFLTVDTITVGVTCAPAGSLAACVWPLASRAE